MIPRICSVAVASIAALALLAGADPDAAGCPDEPPDATATAPAPHRCEESTTRKVLLAVPRALLYVARAPVRAATWAEEHNVRDRIQDVFWNRTRTVGLYPIVTWDGAAVFTYGGAFIDRDLAGLSTRVRVVGGGIDRLHAAALLNSGKLLGRFGVEIGARYRQMSRALFFGYGDAPEVEAPTTTPVDPFASGIAVAARYGYKDTNLRAGARLRFTPRASIYVGGSMRWTHFSDGRDLFGEPTASSVYDLSAVPGWSTGLLAARTELGLDMDYRRPHDERRSLAIPSTGWAMRDYVGFQRGVGRSDPSRFAYFGLDAIQYLDLYGGDHILSLHGTVNGALAPLARIPFTDLPSLGGWAVMRGYPLGRFRDKWAAVASLEYTFAFSRDVASFVFVDAGRVGRRPGDLLDLTPRLSYGFGLQIHEPRAVLGRGWIASTSEGGVLVVLSWEPAFPAPSREVVP